MINVGKFLLLIPVVIAFLCIGLIASLTGA